MSDIIYTPPASGGGGGTTINPTNGFLPVRQNATTFIDSCFKIIASNTLQSVFAGTSKGLELDSFQKLYRLGDYALSTNGTMLVVDENNETISTKNINEPKGLLFDYNGAIYKFGDFNGYGNNTALIIADGGENIYTLNNGAVNGINLDFISKNYYFGALSNGTYLNTDGNNAYAQININSNPLLSLDALNNVYYLGNTVNDFQFRMNEGSNEAYISLNSYRYLYLDNNNDEATLGRSTLTAVFFTGNSNGFCYVGDYFANGNRTNFIVDDGNQYIYTQNTGNDIGLQLNFSSRIFVLGDYNNSFNKNNILVDDANERIKLQGKNEIGLNTNSLVLQGALISPSAGSTSGDHLVITINGNLYKIELRNP